MRKKGISPEYIYTKTPGVINMREGRNFFSSKMIKLGGDITLASEYVIYKQRLSGEQIDSTDDHSIAYSSILDKESNHKIVIDPTQTDSNKDKKTSWVLEVDTDTLLRNYVFAQIKKSRAFEGVYNANCESKSVNISIKSYINLNVINRYKLDMIDLYLEYIPLGIGVNKNTPVYTSDRLSNILPNYRTIKNSDNGLVTILFDQDKIADEYTFRYTFDVKYKRTKNGK